MRYVSWWDSPTIGERTRYASWWPVLHNPELGYLTVGIRGRPDQVWPPAVTVNPSISLEQARRIAEAVGLAHEQSQG